MEKRWLILIISIFIPFSYAFLETRVSYKIGLASPLIVVALWASLLILIPMDAKSKGKNVILWGALTFFGGPVVGIIYSIVANKKITM